MAVAVKVKKTKKYKNLSGDGSSESDISTAIEQATKSLIELGWKQHFLQNSDVTPEEWFENNASAKDAFKEFTCSSENDFDSKSVLIYENLCDTPLIDKIGNQEYVLPPKSSFLLSDIKDIDTLTGKTYDLILMDPPWMNKSVRRKQGYWTLSCESFMQLPIRQLSSPGCLVVVWVTNNSRQMKYVKEKLFPEWDIEYCTDWHWSKITRKGLPVHPFDSNHKKPFENLIIGRRKFDENKNTFQSSISPHKVIVSIPSSIHSQKPPLTEILKGYLPENPKCLELFARYLLPRWTSWGNEVFKLQNLRLFEKIRR